MITIPDQSDVICDTTEVLTTRPLYSESSEPSHRWNDE